MDFSQTKVAFDNPNTIVYSRKLDTALRDSFDTNFVERIKTNSITEDELMLLKSSLIKEDLLKTSRSPTHYSYFLQRVFDLPTSLLKSQSDMSKMGQISRAIKKAIDIQLNYMVAHNNTHIGVNVRKSLKTMTNYLTMPLIIQNCLILSQELSVIINKSNKMHGMEMRKVAKEDRLTELLKINSAHISSIDTTFVWSHSLVWISVGDRTFLAPKSVLLLFHNKLSDLLSVLLVAHFGSHSEYPEKAVSYVIEFCQELIRLLQEYDNKGFDILKNLEGFGIADTIVECEDWVNDEFLYTITADVHKKTGFYYLRSNLRKLYKKHSIPFRHNLMCLSKIIGHPYVNMESGSKSLFHKTTKRYPINLEYVQDCVCYFTRDYLKKYIHKYKKWPPHEPLDITDPPALRHAEIHGLDPDSLLIVKKYGKTDIKHYNFIKLLPDKIFQPLENIIPHLKDKTISLLKSDVLEQYINKSEGRKKISWKDTRLLLAYLLNPTMVHNHTAYLKKYTTCKSLSMLAEYLCIRVVPKEKELKIDYRGFGCKTYEDRMRSLAQEKNVMEFLHEFSDDQAMTLSELSILKKLDAFRRLKQAFPGHRILNVVIDASAWNNHFSNLTVDYMMKQTLDRLYGTTIFGRTHEAFENTFLYVPDNTQVYYWNGQAAGIEGLNQDTWVVTYLSQIKRCLQRFDFQYFILCKGDDLRIAFAVPESVLEGITMHDLKDMIVTEISDIAKELGHTINVEESYGSAKYFAFSKLASIGTMELPQVFRKVQKCHGSNNAFINTLDDYIASSFSNAHSAAGTSANVLSCYAVGLFWASSYIVYSPLYDNISDDELVALLLVPSLLGGFPIIYLHNFFIRAESDLLSPFLGIYEYCKHNYASVAHKLKNFLMCPKKRPRTYKALYKDPYCIPTSRPILPGELLRSYVLKAIKRISANDDIQQLIRLTESPLNKYILKLLDSCNVKRAKVLSTLYSATPEGTLDEYMRKFESGRSILELVILRYSKRRSEKILLRVMKADTRLNKWRWARLKGDHRRLEESLDGLCTRCPAESADAIREAAWGIKIEDVTMPPLQHQIHIMYASGSAYNSWASMNHFTFTTEPGINLLPSAPESDHYLVGSQAPFMGHTTSSGTMRPVATFAENDIILRKVQNLIDLGSWTYQSRVLDDGTSEKSNTIQVIERLLEAYTDEPLSKLNPFAKERRSGTSQHHMRSPSFRESIMPNTVHNIYTRVKGESNTHKRLQESKQNYLINFLHCYCWCICQGFLELEVQRRCTVPQVYWGVTDPCTFCNTPIEESVMIFDSALISMVKLPLLRAMRIGSAAASEIARGVVEYDARNVRTLDDIPGDLQYDHATVGILQEIVDRTFHQKIALQNRYTHHTLDLEGTHLLSVLTGSNTSKDIGLTEIKSCSPTVLCSYTIMVAIDYLSRTIRPLTSQKIELWLNTVPVTQMPWYGLCHMLFSAGILGKIIKQLERMSNLPAGNSASSPYQATLYIGQLANEELKVNKIVPITILVVLSDYHSLKLLHHLRQALTLKSRWVINQNMDWKTLAAIVPESPVVGIQAGRDMCVRALILDMSTVYDDESLLEKAEALLSAPHSDIEIFNVDDLTCDELEIDYENYLDSNSFPRFRKLLWDYVVKFSGYLSEDIISSLPPIWDMMCSWINDHQSDWTITLCYTTLTDCIRVVRAHNPSDSDDNLAEEADLLTINRTFTTEGPKFELPGRSDSRRSPFVVNGGQYQEPLMFFTKLVPTLCPTYDLSITQHAAFRVIGSSNSSPNSLLECLIYARGLKENNFRWNTASLCLYDGVGGFTALLQTLLSGGIIVWHTRPEQFQQDSAPWMIDFNNAANSVHYKYINQGLYDLSSPHVLNLYKEYSSIYHIITSDLEYGDNNIDEYMVLIRQILEIISSLLTIGGLYVIRLDMKYPTVASFAIDWLRGLSNDVHLYIPGCETYPTGFYCVGTKSNIPSQETYLNILGYQPSDTTGPLLIRFSTYLSNRGMKLHGLFRNSYSIGGLSIKPYKIPCMTIGSYGVARFQHTFSRIINMSYFQTATVPGDSTEWSRYLTMCNFDLSEYIAGLESALQGIPWSTTTSINQDTQAHRRTLLAKRFTALGFMDSSNQFKGLSVPYNLDSMFHYKQIMMYYSSLSPRDRTVLPDILVHRTYSYSHKDDLYLVAAYIDGVNIWCSLYSFLRTKARM